MLKLLPSIMLCSVACAYAVPGELDSRASTTNFTLFAYGTDSDTEIGGFPLVYNGGMSNNKHRAQELIDSRKLTGSVM